MNSSKFERCLIRLATAPRAGSVRRAALSLLLAGLVAGCASSPLSNLYTLDMSPSAEAGGEVNISVGRLRVAEALQNKRILIKKSPTEIEYYAAAQWAASLDELLTEKLGVEFGPHDAARPGYFITGMLLAFEQIDAPEGGEAHAKLALEIRKEGTSYYSPPELTKTYDVRMPVSSPTAGGVVQSLSESLEKVARDIVTDAAAL